MNLPKMSLFVALPLIAFYLGTSYGKSFSVSQKDAACLTGSGDTASCAAQKACSEEAKECTDGSFVFRQQPDCAFAACPQIKVMEKATPSAIVPKNGKTKEEQITLQLSQKTGITPLELIITYKNDQSSETTYDGGTYTSKKRGTSGRWIATKINGNWTVTSVSSGIPLCTDINPYYYPKELVPACKDAKGNITAR